MRYRFTGDFPLLMTQYTDNDTDRPLLASPGGDELHPDGTYDMRPAGSWDVPVPPQDGRWEPVGDESEPEPVPAPVVSAAAVPVPPAGPVTAPDVTGDAPADPA